MGNSVSALGPFCVEGASDLRRRYQRRFSAKSGHGKLITIDWSLINDPWTADRSLLVPQRGSLNARSRPLVAYPLSGVE